MSTILNTVRWLSIFTGALSLFYLGHTWFEFGLSQLLQQVYQWYSGIMHPIVVLLQPMAQWVAGLLHWELPVWWKDALVLYLAMGGATARGHHYSKWYWRNERERNEGNEDNDFAWRISSEASFDEDRLALQLLPLRFVAWPLFIFVLGAWEIVSRVFYPHTIGDVVVHGYIGSAAGEFLRLLLGALIFVGINAGL